MVDVTGTLQEAQRELEAVLAEPPAPAMLARILRRLSEELAEAAAALEAERPDAHV